VTEVDWNNINVEDCK